MFRKSLVLIFALICTFSFSACGEAECSHEWSDATCDVPKTCSLCGIIEGEKLSHIWVEATYEAPKTCSACGLTEGEPLENPAYAKDAVRASNAYSSLNKYAGFLVGKDRSMKYYEDERVVYFDLVLNDGATKAYAGRGDNWGLLTAYLKMASQEGTLFFKNEGLDINFHITVFDDRDGTTVLYEVENGNVINDFYADIVPEELKTHAFTKTFNTTYHNYDNQYEITAEYDVNSKVLYYFIRLDGATSHMLNTMSNSEVQGNNLWKSITDATTRWSIECTEDFVKEGHDVLCVYMLIDGNTVEDAFYCVANGNVVYNAFV